MPAAAALVGLLLTLTPLGNTTARWLHDTQLKLLAPTTRSADVLVFDIDDDSLAALKPLFGTWPFKRDVYALAIEQLREAGARAVALDLLLADSGPADAALARAIARPGAPVLLAAAGLRHASDQASPGAEPALESKVQHPAAQHWPTLALPAASVWPEGRAPLVGVITTPLDDDGVLRSLPLWHQDSQGRLPVMPYALHRILEPAAAAPPMDKSGRYALLMPASTHWPHVRRFSELAQVAMGQREGSALRAAVQGRVVFIGSSALLADSVMTTQGQASGTLVLAQTYSSLHQGLGVRPDSLALNGALLLLALLPALATVWRGRPRPLHEAATSAVMLLVVVAVALLALWQWRQPSAWLPPLAVLSTGLAMALFMHQRGQTAARRRLARELEVSAAAARAKSAFLANVSHEIRTPLNALLGVAELLSQSQLSAQQRLHVQVFRESGQALHTLINDLLDLSKIEAGRLELHSAPFDLHKLLIHIAELMRPRAEDKGVNLVLDIAPTLPVGVMGDKLRLEQGLVNLVGNAVKFTASGEVRLAAQPDLARPGLLRFDVSDTGIGIAPSKLETIFEPFAQADGSVTRIYGGTGLGLAITRNVTALMGGTVHVQSTPGQGSTFTLQLPLMAAEPPADAAATQSALPALRAGVRPISVLLAEDNEVNVYIFRAMLDGLPLALQHAPNGPAALAMLRQQVFDIAFIDVQMPGMDGLTVTRELRALEAARGRARAPVVALTANAFASDIQSSLDAGCDRHIAKPFSRELLVQAIEQLVLNGPAQPGPAAPPTAVPDDNATSGITVLDRDAAVRRLNGDATLYGRLAEHALVFLAEWAQHFDQALAEPDLSHAHRLAHDLKSIAATVGAQALSDHAARLEQSLWKAGPESRADASALAQTLAALPPVIAALSTADARN